MSGYDIAITGINAAMRAFDVVGNNIANASTEGYHRQEIQLTPAYGTQCGNIIIGGGVNAGDVTRKIDNLLEQEILRQNSSLEQFYKQVSTMKTIENAFGEISSENGLNASIDAFFGSLSELSAHCDENGIIYQNKVVSCARAMTGQFNTLGRYLDTLENQIELEAGNTVENANILINQIAELNNNIERLESQGNSASNLKDQRDQYVSELSTYIGVSTIARDCGVVDVSVAGIAVVAGSYVTEISIGLTVGGQFGIGVAGTSNYTTNNINGGTIGAYISLKNETIADIRSDLNDLAGAIINQVNQYHVQGVGASGSFTQLSGSLILDEDLTTFDPSVTDGSFFIRVTDTETGQISRHEVDLSLISPQTLSEVADYITTNVTGVNASYDGSRFNLTQSSARYEFDFSPAVLSEPASTSFGNPAGAPDISISGVYTGSVNQTLEFTVTGTSTEVSNGTLCLVDGAGNEYNIGQDYSAGDVIDIGNGIKITVGDGELSAGDTFTVELYADSDTAGFLCATGLNTFFSGSNVLDISVNSDIIDDPSRIAVSLGSDFTDNTNIKRMADAQDEAVSALDSMAVGDFYRKMVVGIGQQLSVKQMQQGNVEVMVQNLMTQQGQVSGVDINTEAALMLTYEQMFQAMSRYLSAVQQSMETLMQIV